MDRGQHGHPDWSAVMQPHTQLTAMHTVYSDTFVSEPALMSSANWATVAHLLDWTHGSAFALHMHQWALAAYDPVASLPLFLPSCSVGSRWSLNRESGVFCWRQRATLLSCHWSGVRFTTKTPEQKGVETSLSSFVCSHWWQYQPTRWCQRVQCFLWAVWADQGLEADRCSSVPRL